MWMTTSECCHLRTLSRIFATRVVVFRAGHNFHCPLISSLSVDHWNRIFHIENVRLTEEHLFLNLLMALVLKILFCQIFKNLTLSNSLIFFKLSVKVVYVRVRLYPFFCPFVSLLLSIYVPVRLCPFSCLSVSCPCPSVSLFLSLSMSVSVPVPVHLCPCPSVPLSLSLSICVPHPVHLCPCPSPSVSLSLPICVPVPLRLCPCPSVSLSLSLSICVPHTVHLCPCPSLSLSQSLSVCVPVHMRPCPFVTLSLFICIPVVSFSNGVLWQQITFNAYFIARKING